MKGIGSHGSYKNNYKDFVIASADMPDVDTTDTYGLKLREAIQTILDTLME